MPWALNAMTLRGLWTLVAIFSHEVKDYSSDGYYFLFFCDSAIKLCHDLLFDGYYFQHIFQGRTIIIVGLDWLTWSERCIADFSVLMQRGVELENFLLFLVPLQGDEEQR